MEQQGVSCCHEPPALGLAWMFRFFYQEGENVTIGASLARAMPGVWKLNLQYYQTKKQIVCLSKHQVSFSKVPNTTYRT